MTKEIEINPALYEDLQVLALLARITWIETFEPLFSNKDDIINYVDRYYSVESLRGLVEDPNISFWLVKVNGLPVGYAHLEINKDSIFIEGENICRLRNIYVLKEFQSIGLGSILWDNIYEKSRACNCEKMWLSVLKTENNAIGLYKKNGFVFLENFNMNIGRECFTMDVLVKEL